MRALENFGKYILLERLAAGGMAEVYLGKSSGAEGIGRFFAVKRILPQYSGNTEFIEMFKEEAKIVMNLNHGNVVSIFEFGIEKDQFFLVMEFVEGQNLRQTLNHLLKIGKSLSVDQIAFMVKEVASGLDHAHRCLDKTTGRPLNIIHRDMSPQNIMISFDGEVKIVDFGIAKAETQFEQTRAGTIKGKFGYMSPEQADGQTVDFRTDVFSLGIIMWELLTKERLFSAQNEAATLKKIRECNIPSLRKLNPSVPAELEKICHKALAKDKNQRYQSAGAFHRDLNRFLNTQYPEFSPQDFAIFMKSIYSDMFLDNRKKLASFAKMQAVPFEVQQNVARTDTLSFSREGTTTEDSVNISAPDGLENNGTVVTGSQKVDLKDLKVSESSPVPADRIKKVKISGGKHQTANHTQVSRASSSVSQSNFDQPTAGADFMNMLPTALFLILSTIAGWYGWNHRASLTDVFKSQPEESYPVETPVTQAPTPLPQVSQVESPSTQMVPLNIQSFPQGASVYVNGERKGLTPYIGQVPANKQFSVLITKDEYLKYELLTEKATPPNYTLRATLLPEPPMGFVNVEVTDVPPNVKLLVKVNDVQLVESLPIKRHKIPAGVPVRIQVINPLTKVSAEQTVMVGQGQTQPVKLSLANSVR